MLLRTKALLLGALLVFMAGHAGMAAEPADRADQAKLSLARQLVDYGKAEKDALAIVTGVRMMASVKGTVLADGEQGKQGKALDLNALLDEAANLAKDDQNTQNLIKETRDMAAKAVKERALCFWEYWCDWSGCYYAWICF